MSWQYPELAPCPECRGELAEMPVPGDKRLLCTHNKDHIFEPFEVEYYES